MTTPGALIAGRYRLRTRVANGGMGAVWEAQDEVLGRRVAIKLLLPQPGISPADAETARNRVIREARITARLHHPHAVTLYDVVEHAGQPALIMQYVPSRSLNAVLQERGVLPEAAAARIGAELASALTAAHLAGIVHRDIKPSNVLITDDGSAKLTDFGISHAAGDVNLTSTGMVSGTPAYLAPEVARGAPSGFPADVFSLGATLYATLEGAPPFGTDVNPMAILHRVASGQVVLPRRSGSLTPLLLHMLAPMPGNRPTMAEVTRALTAAADAFRAPAEPDRQTTALPPPTPTPPTPPTMRDWPAERPAPTSSLSDSLLGARRLPDPPGPPAPAGPRATARPAATPGRRRPLVLGIVAAVVVVGLIALGIALLANRGGGSTRVAATGGAVAPAVSATSSSPPAPARSAAAAAPPATAGATAPAPPPRSSSSSQPPTSSRASRSTAPTPTPTTRTSATPSSTRTTTSSTTTSTTSSTASTRSSDTGTPTPSQLAAAVTDYYAELPRGTDDGWSHLTPHFQRTVAKSRGSYQSFWDGIESVSVSNVQGTAPGTVTATVTYQLKNGERSVEQTTYQLVRSDGMLKIDSQQ